MGNGLDRRQFLKLGAAAAITCPFATRGQRSARPASAQPPSAALPGFIDVTAQSGVHFRHSASKTTRKYLIESMGAGVAMFDYNNDGLLDLFFVNGAALKDPMPAAGVPDKTDPRYWNRLYRNNGNGTFTDVTESAGLQGRGYGMGVAAADFNNDGNVDLLVTTANGNILYRNNGDGTFTDVTATAGVAGSGWCTGAVFVDYDRDGHLDLVVSRYLEWDFSMDVYCGEHRPGYRAYCHPDQFKPISALVFHNNGDGTFTDASSKSGFADCPGKALGIAVNDFDRDGWPDIFIANDSVPEQLFRNNRDGTFTEVGLISGAAYGEDGSVFAGMGADFADYDNDGWPDILVDALANQKYTLFHNAKGTFEDATNRTGIGGITKLHSGWGARMIDFDNDGWRDIFVGQSHVMDNIELTEPNLHYRESPLVMRNNHGTFEDVSRSSGAVFNIPLAARGVAFGDLDNDGFVDVAINCNDGNALILHNQGGNGNHWLMLRLKGTTSNRDGMGAALRMVAEDGSEQYAFVSTAGSYMSASDPRVHFGLAHSTKANLIEIQWPSGITQKLESVAANQILTVVEPLRAKG